jgi:hypothetical protein
MTCVFDGARLFSLRKYPDSRRRIQGLQTGLRMLSDRKMRFFGAVLSVCLAFAACKELSVGGSCRPGSGQSHSGSICDARPGTYQSKIRGADRNPEDQLAEMRDAGVEIESHTVSHGSLNAKKDRRTISCLAEKRNCRLKGNAREEPWYSSQGVRVSLWTP